MTRAQAARAAVLALAVGLAVLCWQVHALLALAPLIIPGTPAALLLWGGRGGRDPYDVLHLYPPPPDE